MTMYYVALYGIHYPAQTSGEVYLTMKIICDKRIYVGRHKEGDHPYRATTIVTLKEN